MLEFQPGIGSYFGIRNINSKINKKIRELKVNLLSNKENWKRINNKDLLIDVFRKLLDVSFKKELPKTIADIFDKIIFKTILMEYTISNTSKEIKEKLQDSIKGKVNELVNELLLDIQSIALDKDELEVDEVDDNKIDDIIKKLQEKISSILPKYLPDFIKGAMKFLAKIDKTDNNKTKGKSIIILVVEKILKQKHIILENPETLSKLFEFYFTKITETNDEKVNNKEKTEKNDNDLIKFIIEQFSGVIEKNTISFNIINDFYKIINDTISKIIANGGENIDISHIFTTIVPKLLTVLTKTTDSQNGNDLLEFVNGVFTENVQKERFIYHFIDNKKNDVIAKDVYLSKENNKQQKNLRKIIIPNLKLDFSTIISSLFKLGDIKELLNKFLSLFIKPIASLINDSEKQSNVKKALFRISAIFTYFYYRYTPNLGGIADTILGWVNPFDPESVITKLIENELKSGTIKLENILGEKESPGLFSFFSSTSYKIFSLSKEAARENTNETSKKEKFKNALKQGILNEKDKKSN